MGVYLPSVHASVGELELSTNFQKTPLIQSLAKAAALQAQKSAWSGGKSYPCTVDQVIGPGIVVVNFEMTNQPFTLHKIKMPVAKPPYIQYPIQKGDKGVAMSADAVLGAMSGLGGGNPNPQTPVGNLSALVFVWVGNSSEQFVNPEAVTILEPTGNCAFQVSPSGAFITGPNGNLTVEGNVAVGTGASGSFVTSDGLTVTVQDGIVTNIY